MNEVKMLVSVVTLGLIGYYFKDQLLYSGLSFVSKLNEVKSKFTSKGDNVRIKGSVALVDVKYKGKEYSLPVPVKFGEEYEITHKGSKLQTLPILGLHPELETNSDLEIKKIM